MSINITAELYSFGVVTAGAVCIFLLFDFFREMLRVFCLGKKLCIVADVIFWCITLIFMWICLLAADNGRLRGYQLAGCILSGIIYFLTLSSVIRFVFKNFFKIIKFFLKILLTPARFLYKILYRAFVFVIQKIILIFKNVRIKKCRRKKRKVLIKLRKKQDSV